ncbi:MAG: hypothetical protein IJD51_04695 [Clostridia bacterium]|nr:hypothetical protein [Clostridia bacterium]
MSKKNNETTVKDLVEVFLPKLWIIILAGVVLAALMFSYSYFFKADTYTSSADVNLQKKGGDNTNDINATQELVAIYADIIEGDVFYTMIKPQIEANGYKDLSYATFKSLVTVTQKGELPTFTVRVTSTDARLSYVIASSIALNIDDYLSSNILSNSISSRITDNPDMPEKPDSKNTVRNSIILGVVGMVLAAVAVWIHASFDVVIRNAKKIEDNLDVPVLGIIPRHDITLNDKGDASNV